MLFHIIWGFLAFALPALGETQPFESLLRSQPSQNFYNFESMDEALKKAGYKYDPKKHKGTNTLVLPRADMTGMCVFHGQKKSPFHSPGDKEEEEMTPSTYFKKYMKVKTPDDILEECKAIPDNHCENGVALMGHATLMMGTGGLLYLDPYDTTLGRNGRPDKPVFFPREKEKRQELVACFKRISKGLADGSIPLTFSSCTLPYASDGAESAKNWDRYSQLLAKDLGITIRTARGSIYTGCNTVYCYAEYGFNWSYPNDEQVYCEDGKTCSWVSPPNRPRPRRASH